MSIRTASPPDRLRRIGADLAAAQTAVGGALRGEVVESAIRYQLAQWPAGRILRRATN
jgi:hypothetical protein